MHIIAQTPRFVIRDFKPEEEMIYLSIFEDKQVTLHLPKRTKGENIAMFHNTINEYATGQKLGRWGIFNNGDNQFMGFCLLRAFDNESQKIELGYAFTREYWGMGIATEMALIMIAYGFTHTDAKEIVAVTTLENIASQRVLEKAGLKRLDNFVRDGLEVAFFRTEKLS